MRSQTLSSVRRTHGGIEECPSVGCQNPSIWRTESKQEGGVWHRVSDPEKGEEGNCV